MYKNLKQIFWLLSLILIAFLISQKIAFQEDLNIQEFRHSGIRTEYVEFKKEGAQKIIFLHGATTRNTTYLASLEKLAEDYHVIAPNIPMFGGSTIPSNIWDFQNFARFFEDFLKEKDLENIILIGHSFGGGISVNLASISDRVDYLILVDSVGGVPISLDEIENPIGTFLTKFAKNFKIDSSKALLGTYDYLADVPRLFALEDHVKGILEKTLQSEYDYNNIDIPVTILWGEDEGDDYEYNRDAAYYLHSLIPGAELNFVGGGHSWLFYEPDRFVKIVNEKIEKFNSENYLQS